MKIKRKHLLILLIGFTIFSMGYILFYSNNILKLLFHKKIWVHRVDSIEKLGEVQANFYGVELDVVFIDSLNLFDVNHPPAESIHLTLDKYLSTIENNKKLHFWLDFKNLETSNQASALHRLNLICEKLKLTKSNFIVESNNFLLTEEFSKSGYQVSYYLNWPGLYTLEKKQLQEEINQIKTKLNRSKYPFFLSSDYRDYDILKEYFPQNNILLWIDGTFDKEKKFENRLKIFKMLSDEDVKIILFNYKSKLKER